MLLDILRSLCRDDDPYWARGLMILVLLGTILGVTIMFAAVLAAPLSLVLPYRDAFAYVTSAALALNVFWALVPIFVQLRVVMFMARLSRRAGKAIEAAKGTSPEA